MYLNDKKFARADSPTKTGEMMRNVGWSLIYNPDARREERFDDLMITKHLSSPI